MMIQGGKYSGWFGYRYEHIDDMWMLPLSEPCEADVTESLKAIGWEGDGDIHTMWFPSFMGGRDVACYGASAFIVKQRNNGTAFILSPFDLSGLAQIHDQNEGDLDRVVMVEIPDLPPVPALH